ncbi:MAG: polysaccharide deacetylase family protein [Clostridia bacterium]|nr:polysaccharide deacetylase family protein [Clostridia bacterium]
MKKWLIGMMVVLLAVGCAVLAAAEDVPEIRFAKTSGTVNGGMVYELVLKSDKTLTENVSATLQNAELGNITFLFPEGMDEVTVEIPTDIVEKKTETVFTLAEGEGYRTTAGDKHTLKVVVMPRVAFYTPVKIGYVGKELNVIVECKNPAYLLKEHNEVELRDETGRVYATKVWNDPSKRTHFLFSVTEEMIGRHTLSVWYNGVKVTEDDDGYCAITKSGEKIISTFETEEPYMCITLDCAYSDDRTLEILDILDKYNVKATFFMTGHYVNTFTETAKEMAVRGHEIGNHSLSHPNLATQVTKVNKRLEQIRTPVDDIQELVGVRVRLFRPPYGAHDGEVLAMVRAEGMEMAKWTIDSHDWDEAYKNDPDRILRRVTKDVKPGTVILFHIDGFNTPEVLDQAIPYYQNELGLKLVTVSEMCEIVGRELPPLPYAERVDAE